MTTNPIHPFSAGAIALVDMPAHFVRPLIYVMIARAPIADVLDYIDVDRNVESTLTPAQAEAYRTEARRCALRALLRHIAAGTAA